MKPFTLIARGLTALALALAMQPATAQTMYRVVPLARTLGTPTAIDSRGRILGFTNNLYGDYCVCDENSCHTLPQKGYGPPHWVDINDQGMVAGYGSKNATSWALRKVPPNGGGARFLTPGIVRAMAPDGALVGRTQNYEAFLYTDHRIELEGLTGRYPDPRDINSGHVIVGTSRAADNRDHATMWIGGGAPVDLGLFPGHSESGALAVNDAGVAVGVSRPLYNQSRPARFADGSVEVFLLPNEGDDGVARAINSAGTIVGWISPNSGDNRAGIVEGNRMIDLNSRLRPEDAQLFDLWEADAINDAGQISALHVDPVTRRGKVVRLDPIR